MKRVLCFAIPAILGIAACKKDQTVTPGGSESTMLAFSLEFDSNQARLNNLGLPADVPDGHAAQTPIFNQMSIHYIELSLNALIPLGNGAILYKGIETENGGEKSVDFDKAITASNGQVFTEINIKDIPPGTYEWVRTSVTYQHYDIRFNLNNIPVLGNLDNQLGSIASFVGFNTYITNIQPIEKTLSVNGNKKQGFWAFETSFSAPYDIYNTLISGEAPTSATTVVNPIFDTSPIPAGSCVVTGRFLTPLVITGKETTDLKVKLSFSINNSFEWEEKVVNGQLDFYADDATKNERIVDMGLRGLVPSWQ